MIDIVVLQLRAGSGGNGRVSFRREKYVPKGGPDGGSGGDGGSIVLKADANQGTLKRYSSLKTISAEFGEPGGAQNRTGKTAATVIVPVPVGTCVWQVSENAIAQKRRLSVGVKKRFFNKSVEKIQFSLEKEGAAIPSLEPDAAIEPEKVTVKSLVDADLELAGYKLIATLDKPDQELLICQGGFGGRGNQAFKSSRETTPLRAEYGSWGEERWVVLEQQLLADIGLIGLPNVGKSTLLSVLTQATPAIGAYPFTTLEPQLGVLVGADQSQECVVADIPGLIAGASRGKGLGFSFLRHIRHCRGLIFVLSIADELLSATVSEQLQALHNQFLSVSEELAAYDLTLLDKATAVCITKTDLYSPALLELLSTESFAGEKPILVSSATHQGLKQLQASCLQLQKQ